MAGEKVPANALAALNQIIFTSATVTGTVAGSKIIGLEGYTSALYFAQVSAVTGTTPTFDIAIQVLMPDSATWQSIANFTQFTGAGGNRYIWKVPAATAEAATATSLTAATQNNLPVSLPTRVNIVVTGTNPSATIQVTAHYLS